MSRTGARAAALLLAAVLFAATPARLSAQGCAQCLDNTASTSPATQRAFAHGIELMTAAAAAVFLATLYVIKRHP